MPVLILVNRTGDADRAAARELAGLLGGLPLALEQGARNVSVNPSWSQ